MMIHEITKSAGKHKARKRIGRGEGSGHGKTAGRGHKGAKSRAGWKRRAGYEGGQMPLIRRMPKRGFTNAAFRNLFYIVNIKQLEALCEKGATVTAETLVAAGVIRDTAQPLKILGDGTLSKKLDITAAKFSAAACKKIEDAGGTVTVVAKKKWRRTAEMKGKKKKADQPKKTDGDKKTEDEK